MRRLICFSLLMVIYVGTPSFAQPVADLLSVQEDEDIFCRACAVFRPDLLPPDSPYLHQEAICGTPALLGLATNWYRLSKRTVNTFSSLFQRPSAQNTFTSIGGHFQIHYNTSGIHAVDEADLDENGVPDYVDETGKSFETMWDLLINQMGYNPPPSDGNDTFDVYIRSLGSQRVYGLTYPETFGENTTSSYMEIDNDFKDNIYFSRGLDGLHVTVAHEFYHSVQFGYYSNFGAAWWQEITSTWMEDVVYPEVNDFYQYVNCGFDCVFDRPDVSLDKFTGLLPFGRAIYGHYLEQVYGNESVRRVWETLAERSPSTYSLADVSAGMPMGGLEQSIIRYSVWNFLTDDRSRQGYYSEASDFPSVRNTDVVLSTGGSFTSSDEVDYLGCAYIKVETSGLNGGLRGDFQLDSKTTWTVIVVLISDSRIELLWPQGTTVDIPNVSRYKEVAFIPIATSLTGDGFNLGYTITSATSISRASDLVGDFSRDGEVNFADFLTFANGFASDWKSVGYDQRLDLNGNGPINFEDFIIFASNFGTSR